ncbi:tyrosine-protein phosphatase [Levilactobacillus yiduensis]|uniref:tyrosine-protein phosphatase n=1 Tax=Levilactobacillus yiduensis TaxID=2953880 RepID=UPI002157F23C|nr:tyrosine-protein phosphatase [Levilactobacillus yiduensis]
MQRSTLIRSLSIASVILSLLSVGGPSAAAATTTPTSAPTVRADDSHKYDDQIAKYGDVKDKLIKLVGTRNTRDLGGYQTADGKWEIRPNRLIRSDNLNGLTNTDKTTLANDHHVTSIVDFRTDSQVDYLPDQPIMEATNIGLSILGEKALTDSSALSPDFSDDGGFYVHQLEFSKSAIDGYHQFLNLLLKNPHATLYHCSSGKDRTGIATVLIMTILGMSDQTIMNDYMQSYQTGRTVKESWLNEYFREIKSRYKDMNHYITNVLGFSRIQQRQLREMYLVSTADQHTPYTQADDHTFQDTPTPAKAQTKPQPAPHPTVSSPAVSAPQAPQATPRSVPDTPVPATITTGSADVAVKPAKVKGKIISSKKLHTKYIYRLKANKKWFKDAHLQKKLGHTAKHKHTTWKLTKVERIKIKGKTYTYYQVQDHAGHKAWILKSYVVKQK